MSGFLRLWTWFSLRQFRRHPWRSVAVLLGIALGAAVFTSVRLATNAAVQSFANSVDAVSGKADRTIVQPGGMVPEGLVPRLLRLPEIKAASPFSSAYVRVSGRAGKDEEPLLLIGIDPILDRSIRSWKSDAPAGEAGTRWGELIGSPWTMIAAGTFLEKNAITPGDSVLLSTAGRSRSFQILGDLSSGGGRPSLASLEGGNVAICDISTFQEFTGTFGSVDRIDLIFRGRVSSEKLDAVKRAIPTGMTVEQPSEARETGRAMIRSYQLNLSVLSFVSLFVGMFLVYSLISLNATSRRKELAVLRAVGASSRLVFMLFIAEGVFFGLTGWVLAIPTSLFMTGKLIGSVSATISNLFARVYVEGLGLTWGEIFLSFAMTVVISVAAACQPAFEASRVRAREALMMRDAPAGDPAGPIRRLALLGIFLAALGWPLSRMHGISGVPLPGYLATFFLFLGFALISPLCLRTAGTVIPPLARKLAGQTAYLGTRYVRDAGTRVAISAGALITAIALFSALAIMVHSFRDTVYAWVHQSINGDLYVRPKMSDLNRYRDRLPASVVAELKSLGGEVDLVPYRRVFLDRTGVPYVLEPINVREFLDHSGFMFLEGSAREAAPALLAGKGALVSEVFSNQTGLGRGDRFRAWVEGAEIDLPILGIIRDYRTQGGVVYFSLAHFTRVTGDPGWGGASIFLKDRGPGLDQRIAALRDRLLLDASQRGYSLESTIGTELRRNILRIFDETFAITTVLLIISLLIAALGIATTLTILVLERSVHFHTMLATGASSGQIRAVISWEAAVMVLVGEALGLACGFVLSALLIFVINRQSFGWTFIYSVDWKALAASLPLVCATALLAALPAAQLVFRQPPAAALREK